MFQYNLFTAWLESLTKSVVWNTTAVMLGWDARRVQQPLGCQVQMAAAALRLTLGGESSLAETGYSAMM
jgi:hypothetical protein